MKIGDHVRVNNMLLNGAPHPQVGKTGVITEILQLQRPTRVLVKVDPDVEPQGTIVVSPMYLTVIP